MKNWLKSLSITAAIALVILPCVLFSACSNSSHPAKGDTYVYDSIVFGDNVPDEMKEQMSGMEEMFKAMKFEFTSKDEVKASMNGETTTMKYSVKDGKVTMGEGEAAQTLTIDGKTLKMENEGITVVFKLK